MFIDDNVSDFERTIIARKRKTIKKLKNIKGILMIKCYTPIFYIKGIIAHGYCGTISVS